MTLTCSKNFVQASAATDDVMGLGNMFSDPNLFGKLAANARTAKHLSDPSFVQKVFIFQTFEAHYHNEVIYRSK
jgi:hypothetical protein